MKKKALVVGGGGREAAMVWALGANENIELFCAPGNAGIAKTAKCFPVKADDLPGILALAREIVPDLTVVGPEAPLTKGIVDLFSVNNLPIIGPTIAAARLEGSKVFAKQFMRECGIPTADFEVFTDFDAAADYIKVAKRPLVVKADGLCGGKGVVVADDTEEALTAAHDMLVKQKFGTAGKTIVIEEKLVGRECSFIVLTDGTHGLAFPSAADFKCRYDGNKGPNTGGMGCYAPIPSFTESMETVVCGSILGPLLNGMKTRGVPYTGFLYAGLMLTKNGLYVLEFNVRMGDPEAAVILPLLRINLFDLLLASRETGELDGIDLDIYSGGAVCVVMTADNYPDSSCPGKLITGIQYAEENGALVFHAGTSFDRDGRIVTAGGRVLDVVGVSRSLSLARNVAYTGAGVISFEGMDYRTDIAFDV